MGGPLNGKTGEVVRWIIGLAMACLVAYFTAQNATNERLTRVETREQTRFEEMQRSLSRIESMLLRQEDQYERILDDWRRGVDRKTGEPLPLQRSIESGR